MAFRIFHLYTLSSCQACILSPAHSRKCTLNLAHTKTCGGVEIAVYVHTKKGVTLINMKVHIDMEEEL